MKSWFFVLILLLAAPPCASAAEPPARLKLQLPAAPLRPGETSRIIIELTGESGQPIAAREDVHIKILGAGTLVTSPQVVVPAGASRVEVPIRAAKANLWQIEASSPGLSSGFGVLVCLAPKSSATRGPAALEAPTAAPQHETGARVIRPPAGAAAGEPRRPMPPPPPIETSVEPAPVEPAPPAGAAEGTEPAAGPSQGHVELIAQPNRLRRGRGGWEPSLVEAYWFDGEAPGQSPRDVNLQLVVNSDSGDIRVAPLLLSIPKDGFKSQAAAAISARRADSAMVRALYVGGQSKPVQVDFLSATPSRLSFAGGPQEFRGLTAVTTDVYVRLLDEDGEPVIVDHPVAVDLAVQGATGTRSYSATVNAGMMQAKVPIELSRPGRYTVLASAPGLVDSAPLNIRFALDWLLIAGALFGGVLGSLTRVLYRRERHPKGLARTVALGVAAALFVLLLSLFGVLSVLGEALPATETLGKVPATSVLGALLLGFVAGLSFDLIFGRFLGGTRGRRSKAAAKEAPAA